MPSSLKVFREAFTSFLFGIIGSLGAGLMLSGMSGTLASVPALALLLPGALGARGTIYEALGAKLSSSLHLGLIKRLSWRHHVVRENAEIAHEATLFISLLLAFIASGLASFSNISANPFLLFFISVVSGGIAGVFLIVITNFIAFQAFRRGWDPDNVSAPLISTIGDFLTVPILFGVALLSLRMPELILQIFTIAGTIIILWYVRKHIVSARFLILPVSVTFQVFAGIFLEKSIPQLLAIPGILIFLPAFLALGGNLSSFVASRISTQLHLGILEPEFTIRKNSLREVMNVILLSFFIFPLLAIATFFIQNVISLSSTPLQELVRISWEAGLLTTLVVAVILGFSVSILSWRFNFDPDDVTIPILSAVADFAGIFFLILVL